MLAYLENDGTLSNVKACVERIVAMGNKVARRPFHGDHSSAFAYKTRFIMGADETPPVKRLLGKAICPEDSTIIIEHLTDTEENSSRGILSDPDVISSFFGSYEEGKELVKVARGNDFFEEQDNEDLSEAEFSDFKPIEETDNSKEN